MTERRTGARHAVILPALCWRGDGSEFHAVTVDLSADGIRLRSAIPLAVRTRLGCSIRDVGTMEACVVWAETGEFGVRITDRGMKPGDVARRLVELARRQTGPGDAVRVHRRIVPGHRSVRVTLADGTVVPARIVNLSASGVALHLDAPPADGAAIRVGRRRASVARQIAGGVGAAFLEPLDAAEVGAHTLL